MPLSAGERLGPYEVIALIGAGGMGEVYRSRDTRLQRDVAIKVLPTHLSTDRQGAARFDREARAIAALNHPNICAIYDVGQQADRQFFVMELLEGESLHSRLSRGPLEFPAFMEHAIALADALDAAHARGLLHRDLKPANIFITTRGQAKILDFGLAKQLASFEGVTHAAEDQITDAAGGVGTLAYMSPEQLRGVPLDARTDVFSLGLVLYEMATGQHAFRGPTNAVISAAILGADPKPPRELRPELSGTLEGIILKALEKDRDLRYQGAAELRTDLKRLRRTSSERLPDRASEAGVVPPASTPIAAPPASSDAQLIAGLLRRHRLAGAALGIVVVAAIFWFATAARRDTTAGTAGSRAFPKLQIQPLTFSGDAAFGAISPDGKFVAFVRKNAGLWVRQISAANDIQVVPYVKDREYERVTVTPDGNSVDFVIVEGKVHDLWRVPLLGGSPRRIVRDIWSSPGWSRDGRQMAFLRAGGSDLASSLIVADENGTNERVVVTLKPPDFFLNRSFGNWVSNRPDWSVDGRSLVLIGVSKNKPSLVILDAITGKETRSMQFQAGLLWEAAWLDDRHVLLNSNLTESSPTGLWSVDLATKEWTPLTREFTVFHWVTITEDRGTALATRTERRSGIWLGSSSGEEGNLVVPETAAGATLPVVDISGGVVYAAQTGTNITLYRLAAGASKPIALAEIGVGGSFTVSPDGAFIVFNSGRDDEPLYRVNADGTGRTVLVERNAAGPAITPDGKTVLYSPYGSPGLYGVPLNGGPVHEVSKLSVATAPSVSPDGRRVLFGSSRPGMVILCDMPACTNTKELELKNWQWAPDGQGVAYVNEQDRRNLWEQPLDGSPARALTRFADGQILEFAWSADGQRLALARGRSSDDIVLLKGLR
jgi:Tol biopolymer transport system component